MIVSPVILCGLRTCRSYSAAVLRPGGGLLRGFPDVSIRWILTRKSIWNGDLGTNCVRVKGKGAYADEEGCQIRENVCDLHGVASVQHYDLNVPICGLLDR